MHRVPRPNTESVGEPSHSCHVPLLADWYSVWRQLSGDVLSVYILLHVVPQNALLNIAALAKRIGWRRVPLRAALLALSRFGLVALVAGRITVLAALPYPEETLFQKARELTVDAEVHRLTALAVRQADRIRELETPPPRPAEPDLEALLLRGRA